MSVFNKRRDGSVIVVQANGKTFHHFVFYKDASILCLVKDGCGETLVCGRFR